MNESDRPRNPPHLINAFGEFCVLNGSQWIATGFALAMTICVKRYSRMRTYAEAPRA